MRVVDRERFFLIFQKIQMDTNTRARSLTYPDTDWQVDCIGVFYFLEFLSKIMLVLKCLKLWSIILYIK